MSRTLVRLAIWHLGHFHGLRIDKLCEESKVEVSSSTILLGMECI